MKNILLIGASGHAKMIIDIVKMNGDWNIIGYIDSFKTKGSLVYGYKILGNVDDIISIRKKFDIHSLSLYFIKLDT
jgi:FlaA1/EpsC-like NDP-sugar epimerase